MQLIARRSQRAEGCNNQEPESLCNQESTGAKHPMWRQYQHDDLWCAGRPDTSCVAPITEF
jgi:hypothetical protein